MEKNKYEIENPKFGNFIKEYSFVIPDYQRAYSWTTKQLQQFLKDILEHCDDNDDKSDNTTYYLGHYILEKPENSILFEIVDGQQRISTIYLFLLVCSQLSSDNYTDKINFNPVSYDLSGFEEIKIILRNNENNNENLEKLKTNAKTSSLIRMIEASLFFLGAFHQSSKNDWQLNINDIPKYVDIINNAYCSFAIYKDKSVATQIFELHNTRGVRLTETEKVKAFLMKNIYINSNSPEVAERDIKLVQDDFAIIFKLEEKVNEVWLRGDLSLDTILMYHLRAVEDGNKTDNFGAPHSVEGDNGSFEYIKKSLLNKKKTEIINYCKNIANELAKSMVIISTDIPEADKLDKNHLIGDILLLDRNKSLIFLLRAFRVNKEIDSKLIECWENFILCYEIINWNGYFYRISYNNRDKFEEIYKILSPSNGFDECIILMNQYYHGKEWFGSIWSHLGEKSQELFNSIDGKKNCLTNSYDWNKISYILYKYEIYNGAEYSKIRAEIFKDNQVSIDHIVARGLSWENLGCENYNSLNVNDPKRIDIDNLWEQIKKVINGIGNLALSTTSYNASDSNNLPIEHLDTYVHCGLKKTSSQIESWKDPNEFVTKINERSEDIIKFISDNIINKKDIWA